MIKTLFLFVLLLSTSFGDENHSTSKESVSEESIEGGLSAISNSVESNEITHGTRIIGGQTAPRGELSYVARLTIIFRRNLRGLCSGTVLSNKHILTAAHCVHSNGRKAMNVIAETNGKANRRFVVFSPNEMFIHPGYNDKFNDDIALLKLNNGAINDYGVPPSLPTVEILRNIFINTAATVAGWGKTSNREGVSRTLQYVGVNVINNESCQRIYGGIVTNTVICTLDRKKGICGGDSGGPLMINRNNVNYVIGVNAFGFSNCEAYKPSGYTYVLPYVSWISSLL